MIRGVGRRLVENRDGLFVQRHELALETQIADPGRLRPPVLLKEEGKRSSHSKPIPLDWILQHPRVPCQLQSLRSFRVNSGVEVQVLAVDEQLQRFGRRCVVRGTDQNRLELDLAGEPEEVNACCPGIFS